jgi:hypothetical protein
MLCQACVEAGHDVRPVAGESGVRLGLLVTLRDLFTRPAAFFGGLPDGPIWRPLVLAFAVWATFLVPSVVLIASPGIRAHPHFWLEAFSIALGTATTATGLVLALTAPLAHLLSMRRGGRGGGALTVRACLYLQGYASIGLTCVLLATLHLARQEAAGYVPPVHPERDRAFMVAGFIVALVVGAMAARQFALGRKRLSGIDAWLFAFLPAGAVAAAAFGAIAAIRWAGPAIIKYVRGDPAL